MGFTAIGVHVIHSAPDERFRVRVKQPGDPAWRDPEGVGECCADRARDTLMALGLTDERATQLLDDARIYGVSSDSRRR